jgi:ParB family chromosome partitioning protein
MSGAKHGLGRGFESLIPTDTIESIFDPTAGEDKKESKLRDLKLDDIIPDEDQPRRDFKQEQLEALADSIKEHGVLQPIVVTKEGDKYKIVAGERRWRASKIAGLEKIPAIIRTLDAQKRLELSLIENVQREDLNAIETATAYAKLKTQFNLSSAEVAKRVGKSEPAVINTMRLLTLPDNAKHAMVEHKLTEGQMRPLITATPEQIDAVLPRIIEEGWSARKVEQYMVEVKAREKAKKTANPRPENASGEARAKNISEHLGVKVKVHTSVRGSGDIVLKFKNEKEFERLCSILTA